VDLRPRITIVIAAPSQPRLPRGADPDMYGDHPTQWRPYLPDYAGEIGAAAKRLAESMDFRVVVEILEHSAEMKAGTIPSAPTLLIIDPWAAQVPALQQRLSRFDNSSHLKLWIRPVVAWNRDHPANRSSEVDLESRLFSTLSHCRRRYRPDSPLVLDGLETMHDFINELPAVIRKAERLYFSELARERSELSQPEEQPRRPRFRGPGPGLGFGPHGSLGEKNTRDEEEDERPGPPGRAGAAPPEQPRPVLRRYDFPNTEDQP
jgi:FxsC-like protein